MQVARKSGSSIGPLNLHSSTLDATAERQRERERDGETSEHPPSAYWFPTVTVLAGGVLGGRVDKLRWERAFLSTPKGATLTARLADRCGGRPSGQGSFGRGPKPLSKQASKHCPRPIPQAKQRERGEGVLGTRWYSSGSVRSGGRPCRCPSSQSSFCQAP